MFEDRAVESRFGRGRSGRTEIRPRERTVIGAEFVLGASWAIRAAVQFDSGEYRRHDRSGRRTSTPRGGAKSPAGIMWARSLPHAPRRGRGPRDSRSSDESAERAVSPVASARRDGRGRRLREACLRSRARPSKSPRCTTSPPRVDAGRSGSAAPSRFDLRTRARLGAADSTESPLGVELLHPTAHSPFAEAELRSSRGHDPQSPCSFCAIFDE